MIRTVIIGSRNIAHTRHIPNIRRSGLAVLHGIYNRSLEHSRRDAGELGCKAYGCLDEIWADSCVDAVIICTPASTHCRYTLAALAAGKHVLCEKPMSVTAGEAALMLEASDIAEAKLMVSHNQRYYGPHIKARELLDAGVIGTVLNVRSCLGLDLPMDDACPEDYNAASEVLSHRIDLMHYLLSSSVSGVTARLTRVDAQGRSRCVTSGDDTAMAILQYENGVIASLTARRNTSACRMCPARGRWRKPLWMRRFFNASLMAGRRLYPPGTGCGSWRLWTRFTVPTGKGAISRFRLQGNVNHWITI